MGSQTVTQEQYLYPPPGEKYPTHHGPATLMNSNMGPTVMDKLSMESDPPSYESEDPEHMTNLKRCHVGCGKCCRKNSTNIARIILGILFVGYTVYLAFSIRYHLEHAKALVVITGLCVFFIIYAFIRNHFGRIIYFRFGRHVVRGVTRNWHCLRW